MSYPYNQPQEHRPEVFLRLTPQLLSGFLEDEKLRGTLAERLITRHIQLANINNGDLAVGLWLGAAATALYFRALRRLGLSPDEAYTRSMLAAHYTLTQFTSAETKAVKAKLLDAVTKAGLQQREKRWGIF